jgi:hypothetical protein
MQRHQHLGTVIELQRLGWIRHLQRVDDARNARKMYQANLTPETTQRKTKNIPE